MRYGIQAVYQRAGNMQQYRIGVLYTIRRNNRHMQPLAVALHTLATAAFYTIGEGELGDIYSKVSHSLLMTRPMVY